MTDPIRLVLEFLENMIDDAESRISGRGSIIDYGMRVRRQTAEDVLRYVQQLAGMREEIPTEPSILKTLGSRAESSIRLASGATAGFGQTPVIPTGSDASVRAAGS